MKKLTLVTGLPYSGKSTKIREIIEKGKEVTVRLSHKELKAMLQPHIAGTDISWTAMTSLIQSFLSKDVSVVIEDSVAKDMYFKDMAFVGGAKFKHIHLKTPMSKCIDRAQKDNKNAIIPHIINTALRFNLYDDTTRPFYIVDITNKATVTDKAIKKMEAAAREKQDIILISTDPESKRQETEKWLIDKKLFACGLPINTLIMAEDGDKRSRPAIRKWIIDTYNLNKFTKKPSTHK
jgi:predicted kinase